MVALVAFKVFSCHIWQVAVLLDSREHRTFPSSQKVLLDSVDLDDYFPCIMSLNSHKKSVRKVYWPHMIDAETEVQRCSTALQSPSHRLLKAHPLFFDWSTLTENLHDKADFPTHCGLEKKFRSETLPARTAKGNA